MFLNKILQDCRERRNPTSSERQTFRALAADMAAPRDFQGALRQGNWPRVIAEFKRASPSKGVLADPKFTPGQVAVAYAQAGASALSILTEEKFFQGSLDDLKQAKLACSIPVLRKDFLLDEWEVYQSRAAGADAILLIAAALPVAKLGDMLGLATSLGLSVLVEVHHEAELEELLQHNHPDLHMIGINNRNLETFKVDLETTGHLSRRVPDRFLKVGESGFHSRDDLNRFPNVDAFLIGESLMRQNDPGMALRQLRG